MNDFHDFCVISYTWFMQRDVHGLIAPDLWRCVDLSLQMSPELPKEV